MKQVCNLFQDVWNRFPYFEGWGVGAKSLGVKDKQIGRQTDRQQTYRTGLDKYGGWVGVAGWGAGAPQNFITDFENSVVRQEKKSFFGLVHAFFLP